MIGWPGLGKSGREGAPLRQVLTLASGALVAQALPILLSPVLTRLYTPAAFGQLAFWLAIIAVVAPMTTLRFDFAIITADRHQVADLVRVCLALSITWTLIAVIGIILLADSPATPLSKLPITYLVLLPVGILLTAQFNTLYAVNTRVERYRTLASATAERTAAVGGGQVAIGWAHNGSVGLVVGQVVGQLVALRRMWPAALAVLRESKATTSSITTTARAHRKFAVFSTPAALANELALQLTALLTAPVFGLTALGHYALVQRMLVAPAGLIGQAVGQVYFRDSAEHHRTGNSTRHLFLSTTRQLIMIGTPVFLAIWVLAPWAFAIAFGHNWATAGDYARVLAPLFFLRFVSMGVSSTAIVHDRQRMLLMWQLSLLACTAVVMLVAYALSRPFVEYLIGYSIIAGVHYVTLWLILFFQVSKRLPER